MGIAVAYFMSVDLSVPGATNPFGPSCQIKVSFSDEEQSRLPVL